MLEKSGSRQNLGGAEKLDFLVWLADQVRGSVEEGRKMKLGLGELTEFLRREGMYEAKTVDAKGAVGGLLALRRRELARLDYDSNRADLESSDRHFELALANMPASRVNDCFEIVVYGDEAARNADHSAQQLPRNSPSRTRSSGNPPSVATTIPGQVASPRQSAQKTTLRDSARLDDGVPRTPSTSSTPYRQPMFPPPPPPNFKPPETPPPCPGPPSRSPASEKPSGKKGGCTLL